MQFNVAQLLKEPIGSTRSYELDENTTSEDGSFERGEGSLFLMRTDEGVWVRLHVEIGLWGACSRCLKRFLYPVDINIDDEYLATAEVATGKPIALPEYAEGSFTIDHSHVLSLDEAIRQYVMLQGPMKLLCQDDCSGLCPSCGVDRNVLECGCAESVPDPRWGPLSRLLESGNF